MRKKRPTYLSLLNLLVFGVFFGALYALAFDITSVHSFELNRTELEIILLQSISFLLVLCAFQLPKKVTAGWRPALLALSFIALSESSLVALLTPVS